MSCDIRSRTVDPSMRAPSTVFDHVTRPLLEDGEHEALSIAEVPLDHPPRDTCPARDLIGAGSSIKAQLDDAFDSRPDHPGAGIDLRSASRPRLTLSIGRGRDPVGLGRHDGNCTALSSLHDTYGTFDIVAAMSCVGLEHRRRTFDRDAEQ